jgi:DNA-binding transcriptional MerR regulator
MADRLERTLGKYASVTVEAAARLVDVDVATIRHWSEIGSLVIEQRGDMDVVRLDQVRALTTSSKVGSERTRTRHGSLRALLRDAAKVESLSVSELQQHVRERAGSAS